MHEQELETFLHHERMQSECYICNGLNLPFHSVEKISTDMLHHIVAYHLPLKCNKCTTIFETLEDFKMIGKCCDVKNGVCSKENMGDIIKLKLNDEEKDMTPMSEINMRWGRKSREFGKVVEEVNVAKKKESMRQTSTPMQSLSSLSPFDMQMSSIKYLSNASETNFSPLATENATTQKVQPLPPPPKIPKIDNKNRPRIPSNNTPLRHAVMTKSIQRAIACKNAVKNKVGLQQRRMVFESQSSGESAMSLLKVEMEEIGKHDDSEKPLDLRLSPALRRDAEINNNNNNIDEEEMIHKKKDELPLSPLMTQRVEYEERQILVRCSSDTAIASFKSCVMDTQILTPKISGNGFALKKTISFETPLIVEKTPVMMKLKPKKDIDNEDNDVFYTPCGGTPSRRRYSVESGFDAIELEKKTTDFAKNEKKEGWNFVKIVVDYAKGSTSSAGSGSSDGEGENICFFFFILNMTFLIKFYKCLDFHLTNIENENN